jgi:hypothetical protein
METLKNIMLTCSFLMEMCKRDSSFISLEYQVPTFVEPDKVHVMAADIQKKGEACGIDILILYVEPIVMIRFTPVQ